MAGDPVLSRRVRARAAAAGPRLAGCAITPCRARRELRRRSSSGPKDPRRRPRSSSALATSSTNPQYREGQPFAEYAESLRRRFRPPAPPPEAWKNLEDDEYLDVQDNQFRLPEPGKWAAIVDDPRPPTARPRACRATISNGPCRCRFRTTSSLRQPVALLRGRALRGQGHDGPAMTMGIYDTAAKKGVAHRGLNVAEAAGKDYRLIDLGVHALSPDMYIWVAPPKRPGDVTAVYVDRVLLVREKR